MTDSIAVTDALEGPRMTRTQDRAVTLGEGRITSIEPGAAGGARRLLMPGLVNAHDHCRPLSPTSFGGANKPLETWLLRLTAMPATDPYLAALAAFGRAARTGCVSIMAHYARLHGPMAPPDEAALVAKAARDIGVRATFALSMRNRNPLVYGSSEPALAALPAAARRVMEPLFQGEQRPFKEQIAIVEACAAAAEGPLVSVQYGPAGVQWCSDDMLRAIAQASADTGRRVHMHCLETKYQRGYADAHYPQGVITHLKEIGLLSPRLTLAHCVYARPEELDMIAEAGTTIATNFSSNLHLRSGIAPIADAIGRGCRVAIGIDASALDEDDDALREMRLAHFAHGGWGFDEVIAREDFLAKIVRDGRRANGAPGDGLLAPGGAADMVVLDLAALDRDAIMPVDPLDLLFARASGAHVDAVYVAGRRIASGGKLVTVDLDAVHEELRARYRIDVRAKADYLDAFPALEASVAQHFRDHMGCC